MLNCRFGPAVWLVLPGFHVFSIINFSRGQVNESWGKLKWVCLAEILLENTGNIHYVSFPLG